VAIGEVLTPRPNFFLVGAAKAGTTSLWSYLSQHPEIYMSPTAKEPHYFLWAEQSNAFEFGDWRRVDKPYHHDWDAYLRLFDGATQPIVGEASVFYLPHPTAATRIEQRCPGAKIAICLRDPTRRAYSWYRFNRMRHEESAPTFRKAIEKELATPNLYYAGQYLGLGLYSEQVKRYLDVMGSDRVHVILYDDLQRDAGGVMRSLFRFLSVDDNVPLDLSVRNRTMNRHPALDWVFRLKGSGRPIGTAARCAHGLLSGSKTYLRIKQKLFDGADRYAASRIDRDPKYEPMGAEDERYLRNFFSSDVSRLQDIIDRDLRGWLAEEQ
jgi:Sulfotransferase domain